MKRSRWTGTRKQNQNISKTLVMPSLSCAHILSLSSDWEGQPCPSKYLDFFSMCVCVSVHRELFNFQYFVFFVLWHFPFHMVCLYLSQLQIIQFICIVAIWIKSEKFKLLILEHINESNCRVFLLGSQTKDDIVKNLQIQPIMQFIDKYQLQWKNDIQWMDQYKILKAMLLCHQHIGKLSFSCVKKKKLV